jgi:glycerol-3-phosphate dehydrogenase
LRLIGSNGSSIAGPTLGEAQGLHSYGSEAAAVASLPGADRELGSGLTEAMVRFAARNEYARTVEDMLARRWRLLFLDARLAGSLAEKVGTILHEETGANPQVGAFLKLASSYLCPPS